MQAAGSIVIWVSAQSLLKTIFKNFTISKAEFNYKLPL